MKRCPIKSDEGHSLGQGDTAATVTFFEKHFESIPVFPLYSAVGRDLGIYMLVYARTALSRRDLFALNGHAFFLQIAFSVVKRLSMFLQRCVGC